MKLDVMVRMTIAGLEREHPALAAAINRWSNFLCHAVERVSRITNTPPEDVLGDIFVGLVKVNDMYRQNLWRYNGNLYRIVAFDGMAVLIETLPHNVRLHKRFWTDCKNLELVKRGKIESSVYREIHQQYVNLLASHFTAKKGFVIDSISERAVTVRSGPRKTFSEKRKVKNMRKSVHLVDIDIPSSREEFDHTLYPSSAEISSYLSDYGSNPEQQVISDETIMGLGDTLSPEALVVLGCLLDNPAMPTRSISQYTGLSHRQVGLSRFEIERDYEVSSGIPLHTFGKTPIYLRASQVC